MASPPRPVTMLSGLVHCSDVDRREDCVGTSGRGMFGLIMPTLMGATLSPLNGLCAAVRSIFQFENQSMYEGVSGGAFESGKTDKLSPVNIYKASLYFWRCIMSLLSFDTQRKCNSLFSCKQNARTSQLFKRHQAFPSILRSKSLKKPTKLNA